MTETTDSEKKKYVRNIIFLNIQKKEIIELTKNSIENQVPIECKLINKDIVNDYMSEGISDKIYFYLDTYKINNNLNKYSEMYDIKHINNIIKEKEKSEKINDIDLSEKFFNPEFFIAEDLKMNDIKYPFNFFILRKSVFNEIKPAIDLKKSLLKELKDYEVLIGKEGIFIWEEKPHEKNEFQFIIYYIKEIKNEEEYNINKIILLKKKPEDNLNKYLELTKLKSKSGYFNIIDDGKIIGKYLNIIKNTNYQYRESNVGVLDELKMKAEIESFERKSKMFDLFLSHILLSLLNIEKLKQYFLNMEKIYEKSSLFKIFINIIKKLDSEKYDFDSDIKNFLNLMNEKNLSEKLEISENKEETLKDLIILLLDEFQNELNQKKEKNVNNIFEIFTGIKDVNSIQISFNSMELRYTSQGNSDTQLISSIYKYKEEEKIQSFPEVMFLSVYDKSNKIIIPTEFQIKSSETEKDEKKYILRSSISFQEGDNMASIIKNKNNEKFYKLMLTNESAIEKEEINDKKYLSNGFIFFYEVEKTDNKKEEGNLENNKNELPSVDNKNSTNQANENDKKSFKGFYKIFYNSQSNNKNKKSGNKIIINSYNPYNNNNFNNNNFINYNNNFNNFNNNFTNYNNNNNTYYNNNSNNYNNNYYNNNNCNNYNNNSYCNNNYNNNNYNNNFMMNNQGRNDNFSYH